MSSFETRGLRPSRRAFLAGAASAAILPNTSWASDTPVRGGTLVAVCTPGEPNVLTAAIVQTGQVQTISAKIFDGLVRYGDDFKLEPELATSWTVSDDGKEIRFNLRPNVRWHDGQPFTSADVKYTYENVWLKIHPRARATFAAVEALETPDPLTVVFKLRNPSGVILGALNAVELTVLPRHLYEGTDVLTNPHNIEPIGTGPFRFKEWVRGDKIVLERNPDYWDTGKPYLDQVVYRVIPDATARYAAFETGAIQLGMLSPISINDVERAQKSDAVRVEFKGYEWLGSAIVAEFNVRKPPFDDVRVRRAVAHSIDLNALSKVTTRGFTKPGTSPVLSSQPKFYAGERLPFYAFDRAAAERLLDEAGYPRKGNGARFAITLDWLPFGENFQRFGEFIRQALKPVGIDVTLRNQDLPQFFRRVYSLNDFDFIVSHRAGFGDPQIGIDRIFWSKAILKDVPWSNGSGYSSPEMDRLIEGAHLAATEEQRIEFYKQVQIQAQTDIPHYTLLESRQYTIASKRVRGLTTGSNSVYDSLKDVWLAP
ncbi:ABC transporter substrate-binding protein [Bradyrhizobium sp. SSUT18]|uniref:ABC transporter substrate-binding protein n=1 Tax=Bradyrhizobium sp. SSUT18 TaxID=3040602 RepID=UPI00244ABDEF|nr:ABC transporter substrate-binding protein [Bradyrhizobium sp. SSUT18]MDH2399956.1 ABC transporter substrate-binding protein [Bradyrhizobium sp. SSUT18]